MNDPLLRCCAVCDVQLDDVTAPAHTHKVLNYLSCSRIQKGDKATFDGKPFEVTRAEPLGAGITQVQFTEIV